MNAWLADFHFLRPWWLLALVALPILWTGMRQRGTDAGAWSHAIDAHLLKYVLSEGEDAGVSRAPLWLAAAAWILAALALAGPAWERLPQPLFQNRAARVIALELGPSMAAQDIAPSRFERARYKIADILKRSGDVQTALIAYAGDAFVVAPLTDDVNTVGNLVDALDPTVMPVGGNQTGLAIDLGVKLIRGASADRGEIILLADAIGDGGSAAAARARADGINVSVIGIGSSQGAPVPLAQGGFLKNATGDIVLPKLDSTSLAALAAVGGGHYAELTNDGSDVAAVVDTLASRSASQVSATQATTTRYLDRGPWLLLLLLPVMACGFRRGWLMALPLALSAYSHPASALSWSDLWLRPDQQARNALDQGNAQQAQDLAHDPALHGSAAYRAGDFGTAAQDFAQRDDADAAYNNGNALAKQQHFEQALAAYDQALKQKPDMADALANKKAIEDWLKQQQQKQQQKQKDSKDHQGHDQKNDSSDADQDNKQGQQDADQQGQDSDSENSQQGQSGQQNSEQQKDQQKSGSAQQGGKDGKDEQSAQPQGAEADAKAQQKFSESMDQALAGKDEEKEKKAAPVRLGAIEGDKPQDEHEQAVQQWLQRVPDDPGGLLRRKFQLEYQRRQHGGTLPGDDGP